MQLIFPKFSRKAHGVLSIRNMVAHASTASAHQEPAPIPPATRMHTCILSSWASKCIFPAWQLNFIATLWIIYQLLAGQPADLHQLDQEPK